MSAEGLDLFCGLYLARRAEEYVIKHYPEDEMRTPMHMSMGQEHIPVGICNGLDGKADVFASYRSHAAFLAQIGDTDRFFGEMYGRVNGTAEGKSGSMHLSAPSEGHILSSGIVASPISVAVGTAFANKRLKTGRTAVVFFGDGAVDSGTFWESLNAACLFKLPVFFVCEDNRWAVHTPIDARRGYDDLTKTVSTFRCHTFNDDSNDVESVAALARKAHALVQEDPRPVFMNIRCFRHLDHIGIETDWDAGYRDPAEREEAMRRDSLAAQRRKLIERGMTEDEVKAVEAEIDERIERSVQKAKQAPTSDPSRLYYGVFHETD